MVVSDPVLANKEVNVLQAVNLTLATSAVLALASTLPDLFDDVITFEWLGKTLLVLLILGWTLKLLVENHRSFTTAKVVQQPKWATFQLFMTVFMFLSLVVSAGNADTLKVASVWLMASLIVGLIWLAALAGRYIVKRQFKAGEYSWQWVGSAACTVAGSWIIFSRQSSHNDGITVILMAMMLVALVADAYLSDSFGKLV